MLKSTSIIAESGKNASSHLHISDDRRYAVILTPSRAFAKKLFTIVPRQFWIDYTSAVDFRFQCGLIWPADKPLLPGGTIVGATRDGSDYCLKIVEREDSFDPALFKHAHRLNAGTLKALLTACFKEGR
jgi:hypothetical protein